MTVASMLLQFALVSTCLVAPREPQDSQQACDIEALHYPWVDDSIYSLVGLTLA